MKLRLAAKVTVSAHASVLCCAVSLWWGVAAAQLSATGPSSPEVLYGGCREIHPGPVCELTNSSDDFSELTLWVEGSAGEAVVRGRWGPLAAERTPIAGGQQIKVRIPKGLTRLRLKIPSVAGELIHWELTLAPTDTACASLHDWAGSLSPRDAISHLEAVIAAGADECRSEALFLLGRMYRRDGQYGAAASRLQSALDALQAEGKLRTASKAANVLTTLAVQELGDFELARRTQRARPSVLPAPAEFIYFDSLFAGKIALSAGETQRAIPPLQRAAAVAQRLGWPSRHDNAQTYLALQYATIGRFDEARGLLDSEDGLDRCAHAQWAHNVGWVELLRLEAKSAGDARVALEHLGRAKAAYDSGCGRQDPTIMLNVTLDLALAHLHAGHLDKTKEALARARQLTGEPPTFMRLWELAITGRQAMSEQRFDEADQHLRDLEALATLSLYPDLRWYALVYQGLLAERRGDSVKALAHYASARQLQDEALLSVPFYEGRQFIVSARHWATARRVRLLMEQGDAAGAFDVVREEQIRATRAFDERCLQPSDDIRREYRAARSRLDAELPPGWGLAAERQPLRDAALSALREILSDVPSTCRQWVDENRQPRPGELLVAFQRHSQGWLVLAQTVDGVEGAYADCEESSRRALGTCLISHLTSFSQHTSNLSILLTKDTEHIDFHELLLETTSPLSNVPVAYVVAAQDQRIEKAPPSPLTRALIVGAPRGLLRSSLGESLALHLTLTSGPTPIEAEIFTGFDAKYAAVAQALPSVDLFHFAGHAASAGPGGWDSALELSGGESFSITDVMALPSVPSYVVLSACETVGALHTQTTGVVGPAQAFIQRGARWALGTSRLVPDDTASRLINHFYDEWLSGRPVAEALRRSQLAVRASHPQDDWAAFRVLIP